MMIIDKQGKNSEMMIIDKHEKNTGLTVYQPRIFYDYILLLNLLTKSTNSVWFTGFE